MAGTQTHRRYCQPQYTQRRSMAGTQTQTLLSAVVHPAAQHGWNTDIQTLLSAVVHPAAQHGWQHPQTGDVVSPGPETETDRYRRPRRPTRPYLRWRQVSDEAIRLCRGERRGGPSGQLECLTTMKYAPTNGTKRRRYGCIHTSWPAQVHTSAHEPSVVKWRAPPRRSIAR